MEEPGPTDVKFPIETWMQSQDISGFPTMALTILGQLDLESLSNCRQVSMTFKNFLDKNFGLTFWIKSLCQVRKKYYLAKLPMNSSTTLALSSNLPGLLDPYGSWTHFLEIIRTEGSIDKVIKLTTFLIKQSESDESFCKAVFKLTLKKENNGFMEGEGAKPIAIFCHFGSKGFFSFSFWSV
jgi:hypothetical protein